LRAAGLFSRISCFTEPIAEIRKRAFKGVSA
jgi:hypothetical protein